MHSRLQRLAALLGACLGLARLAAQAPVNPNHVTFYTQPNFKGDALVVEAGASVPDLGQMQRPGQQPWLFAISSIQINGAAAASIYSGTGFSGQRLDVMASIADLYSVQRRGASAGTWDRAIASLHVTGTAATPGPATTIVTSPTPAPPPTVITAPAPATVITTPAPMRHEAPPPTVVIVPQPAPPPPVVREARPHYDRRTADTIIYRAYRDVLNRAPDPEGLATYRHRLMFEGWTEHQIIRQLQRSGEARAVNADEAITRLYREVLGRDPDPNGLAHYRAKWRDGWTQGQIRDDLRRSNEGRNTYVREVITRAYRDLLGRDPDPGGYATYERAMRERGYSERDVRAAIMSSEEYRQRHPRGR